MIPRHPDAPARRPRRPVRSLAVVAALALAAGCSDDGDATTEPTATDTAAPDVADTEPTGAEPPPTEPPATDPPGTDVDTSGPTDTAPPDGFAVEPVEWEPCGDLECATVTVPADHADPSAGTLDIAINVRRADDPDARVGYLYVNPGGPGGSGVDLVASGRLGGFVSDEVYRRFDIVGFDPRGVGRSDPSFDCGPGDFQQDVLADLDLPVEADDEARAEELIERCVEEMGPAAFRLHTDAVVRDLDLVRQALGDEQITYLGYSYGSDIGVWYAELFPDRVRAAVLDGADDILPEGDTPEERIEESLDDLEVFASQLDAALAACVDESCPIYDGGDPTGAYLEAMEDIDLVIEETGNPSAGVLGVVTFLYDETDRPQLWAAIDDLRDGDPAAIVEAYRFQQPEDGLSFTGFVNCLDGWVVDPEESEFDEELAELGEARFRERFPLLAAASPPTPTVDLCGFLADVAPPPLEGELDAAGVPLVVIGNPSDPATSFSNSERLAEEVLADAYLVVADHYRHTVYPQNTCVVAIVDAVLIDAELPAERRTTCEREEPTAESFRPALVELCRQYAAAEGVDDGPCEAFADAAIEGATYEELEAVLFGDGDPSDLLALLEESLGG